MTFEVCTDSIEGVKAAIFYGAKRVELCAALELGGLTPSYGCIMESAKYSKVETHVIIRPKAGGFCYSPLEIEQMKHDIEISAECGARGVVWGVLNAKNEIHFQQNKELMEWAKNFKLETTFHRAFDFVESPYEGIELLIEMGFDRLLTSGQQSTAELGIENIRQLVKQANRRIQIMAGSGVNANNALALSQSGVDALHFTARKPKPGKESLNMGIEYMVDEEKIESIIENARA